MLTIYLTHVPVPILHSKSTLLETSLTRISYQNIMRAKEIIGIGFLRIGTQVTYIHFIAIYLAVYKCGEQIKGNV